LDYLRSVAGTDNPLIIVQSRCDTPEIRADVPVRLSDWIGSSWTVDVSAKTDFGLERLKPTFKVLICSMEFELRRQEQVPKRILRDKKSRSVVDRPVWL
jgi:hypothetical protein